MNRRRGRGGLSLGIGAVLLSLIGIVESARAAQPVVREVRMGFNQRYKLGHWTPLSLGIEGGDRAELASVVVTLPDGDDVDTRFSTLPQRPVQLIPGKLSWVTLEVKPGRELFDFPVEITTDSGTVVRQLLDINTGNNTRRQRSIPAEGMLCVQLGANAGVPSELANSTSIDVATLTRLDELPTRWSGYDGVDVVVINASRPDQLPSLIVDSVPLAALTRWVELGGHVIFCAGVSAEQVCDASSPWSSFAPGKFTGLIELRTASRLEDFCGDVPRIPPRGRSDSIGLQVPNFDQVVGRVRVSESGAPLIVQFARGFGQVTFVGLDLDQTPLAGWEGRSRLLGRLLLNDAATTIGDATGGSAAQSANQLGYADLSGQLRSVLDQFEGVRVIPFALVALAIIVYVLLIGPGDYWFLKRVVKRMEWTWITFPAIAITLSCAAYAVAHATKGSRLRLNQVEIVDLDASTGMIRGTSWYNLFSPLTASYDLSLRPTLPLSSTPGETRLAWMGTSGGGWNGMHNPTATGGLFGRSYAIRPTLDEIAGVPIDIWSTKPFVANWTAHTNSLPASSLRLAPDGTLAGSVVNPLNIPLMDCWLAYDRWVYRIHPGQEWQPGEPFEIVFGSQRDLQAALKDFSEVRTNQFGNKMFQARTYDPAGLDPGVVLRAMMFYEATGGRNYTGMPSADFSRVDLSEHLKFNRAVLVGRTQAVRATQLLDHGTALDDSQDQSWAYYRILWPIASP